MTGFSEDEVLVLKALAAGLLAARKATGSGNVGGDDLPDHALDKDWADRIVKKDPPKWSGESMVGRRYSDCPAEWHDSMSGFKAWAAKKGKEENPPRLRDNGKPWWEADEFESKLCRAWARRIRTRGSQQTAPEPSSQTTMSTRVDEDDIPF